MFLELFLFAKKMKFLTKGGIHCISRSLKKNQTTPRPSEYPPVMGEKIFPWHFYFMRGHSLVELTEHDGSAADIILHSM